MLFNIRLIKPQIHVTLNEVKGLPRFVRGFFGLCNHSKQQASIDFPKKFGSKSYTS